MTVPYMKQVADATVITFLRLLFRWRGSVWKSIYIELCWYMLCYYTMMTIYHTFMAPNRTGVIFIVLIGHLASLVPVMFTTVTFAMGFYVTQIYNRWWAVFMMLPWPDSLLIETLAYVRDRPGSKHRTEDKNVRKTIARYLSLSFVLVFRDISERVKTRFPTLEHLVGTLLTENEKEILQKEELENLRERVYWMPIEWISGLLKRAYQQRQIDDIHYSKMISTLMDYRERLHNIMQYDTVNLPLIYTQVVHLVTYAYFGIQLIATQKTYDPQKFWFELLPIPGYAVLEFIFLVGWLKAAEVMINPFGMDDDDFDIDILIERNFLVAYSFVGNLFEHSPKLVDLDFSMELTRKKGSEAGPSKSQHVLVPSAVAVEVPEAQQAQVAMFHNEKQVQFVSKDNPALNLDAGSSSRRKMGPTAPASSADTSERCQLLPAPLPLPPAKKIGYSQLKEKPSQSTRRGAIEKGYRQPHASRAEKAPASSKRKTPSMTVNETAEKLEMWKIMEDVRRRRRTMEGVQEADLTQRDEEEPDDESPPPGRILAATPLGSMISPSLDQTQMSTLKSLPVEGTPNSQSKKT